MTYIWVFTGLIVLFFLWSFLEQKFITTSKYKINLQGKDKLNLSFVVLADVHNKSFGKNNRRLVKKILEHKPDFVIIAGDLITKRRACYPGNGYDLMKEISERYPVYYAYGNHEQAFEDLAYSKDTEAYKQNIALYESWNLYKEKLKQLGVYLLDNKSIILHYKDSKLTITGLSLSQKFYGKGKPLNLEQNEIIENIGTRNKEGHTILIAHNPVYFKKYVEWGADLILSGHVHGGLVRIPFIGGVISPQMKLFPKYDAGLLCEDNKRMVISRGLGGHSFMPRFLNMPELVLIEIKSEEGAFENEYSG